MNLGCVDCQPGTHWKPTTFYIYNGNSLCRPCLEKRQTPDVPLWKGKPITT